MSKLTLFLSLVLILALAAFKLVKNRPTLEYPYPYTVKTQFSDSILNMAQDAHILVLGDSMARSLRSIAPYIGEKLSPKLRDGLKLRVWAEKGEGIHRTLHKLRSLKKYPPVIIYTGGKGEFFERRFDLQDKATILKNIETFNDSLWGSLIISFPWFSKFAYKESLRYELTRNTPDMDLYSASEQQQRMELFYIFYRQQLEELRLFCKKHKIELIVLTTPLNLKSAPERTCENTTSPLLTRKLESIEKIMNSGDYKTAYSRMNKSLDTSFMANADAYYLAGKLALRTGRPGQALELFTRAHSFDCSLSRANPITNSLIRELKNKDQVTFIDFDLMAQRHFNEQDQFIDENYPKGEIYHQLSVELSDTLESLLRL